MEKINKNKKLFNKIFIVSLIVAFVIFILILNLGEFMLPFSFLFITLYIIAMVICYNELVKKPFKMEVVGNVLKSYKSTIEYTYKDKMQHVKDMIRELKLIPSASNFNFTDIIKDDVDNIGFCSMELHATHTTSNGKTTTTVTDFKGKVFEIDLESKNLSYVLKEEKWKHTPSGYSFIELEVIDFNSKFNLYTTDEHEIFKVFTPNKIKKMIELERKYDNVMMIVQNVDKLYILLYDREDLFESMDNPEVTIIEDYKKQIEILKDYLDVINEKYNV